MRVWTPEDYGGAPLVGPIVQHPRSGFIYAANGTRILEFDGIRWRGFAAPGGMLLALAIDARGRVWFSTTTNVGHLEPDGRGELRAISAQDRLPPADRSVQGFGAALATADGVFFVNRHRVVRFDAGGGAGRHPAATA